MTEIDLKLPERDERLRRPPYRARFCTAGYDQAAFGHETLEHGLFDTFAEDDLEGEGKAEYNQGVIAYERGDIVEAERLFERVVEITPRARAARNNLAICRLQRSRMDEGISILRDLAEEFPDDPHVNRNLGVALSMHGDRLGALRALEFASDASPEETELLFLRAMLHDSESEHDRAIECMVRATQLEPEACWLHDNLGVVLHGAGRLEEAIGAFDRAIELDSSQSLPWYNRGRSLGAAGRASEAVESFEKHLSLEPDHSCAVYDLGRALSEAGEHARALEKFREYRELEPGDPQAHCSLGVELMLMHRLDEAEEAMRMALTLDPWFDWAVGSLGTLAEFRGDFTLASAFYREALARDGTLDGVRSRWIRMLLTRVSAQAAMDEMMQNPNAADGGSWMDCVDYLSKQNRRDEALAFGAEMVRRYADEFWAHGTYGVALAEARKSEEALAQFQDVVRLNPEDLAGHYYTARMLCETERFNEALPVMEFVLDRSGEHVETLRLLAYAHAMLSNPEAEAFANRILAIEPADPLARSILGIADPEADQASA